MHQLNAAEQDARTSELLQSNHWPRAAFDRAMILLHNIVEVLHLTDLDLLLAPGVDVVQCRQVRSASVDRHCPGLAVVPDRFLKVTPGRSLVPVRPQ